MRFGCWKSHQDPYHIISLYIAEYRFPVSPVFCEICNSWTWQNTAETPHSQNCASQGCSWIGGHQLYPARGDALRQSGSSVTKKIMVDQCWSSFSSLIYINIAIWGFEGTILGQTQVLKQFCECHRTWTLLYREMWKSSPCCLSAVSPVSLQNFWWIGLNYWMSWSTWFMQWFNCILLDFPVKLPVFCILTLDVIGVYLDWIIFAGSLYATHDLAEFGKSANADDLGIGQSCETIQGLEMSWTSCLQNFVRYLTTLPAHMINAMNFANCWSCRFCQAALGCPMPPHKPVRSQKNMTLYMEVRAAFICHRTCWLVVTSHFTQLNPCSVCLFDKDKNPADLHQQDDLVINLSMLFHMPLQSSKHFGSVQGIPAFWLGTFQSLKPPSLFITSKASSWPHGFSAATALLIFAMQTAWESDGIWFHPSSGSVSQPRARLTMLTKA